jgi:hypothetical protein
VVDIPVIIIENIFPWIKKEIKNAGFTAARVLVTKLNGVTPISPFYLGGMRAGIIGPFSDFFLSSLSDGNILYSAGLIFVDEKTLRLPTNSLEFLELTLNNLPQIYPVVNPQFCKKSYFAV